MAITQIPQEFIPVNAISGTIIADNAITAVHIATNAVSGTLIADNAITAVHIATNAISGTLIADNAVTAVHIAGTSVTATQIQDNAIGTGQLAGIARGKIIYGDSSGDPQLLTLGSSGQVLKSDGSDISWGSISTPITALNNATENELLTVSSTTTELNAESGLTWDTNTLAVTGAVTVSGAITGNLTGNASGTATALATARTIGGTSFDGTANIAVATATEATNVTAAANNSTDETVYPTFVDGATGTQGIETDTGLTYNPATGTLTAVEVSATTFDITGTNITTTAAELNLLDGVTATTAELNYVDGVTSAIQTQMDTKASTGKAIAMAMIFG